MKHDKKRFLETRHQIPLLIESSQISTSKQKTADLPQKNTITCKQILRNWKQFQLVDFEQDTLMNAFTLLL